MQEDEDDLGKQKPKHKHMRRLEDLTTNIGILDPRDLQNSIWGKSKLRMD